MKRLLTLVTVVITLSLPLHALGGGKGGGGGFSGGRSSGGFGGRSYSGGSSFKPSFKPSASPSIKPSIKPSIGGGKSYSGGSSSPPKGVNVTRTPSEKPKSVTINKSLVRDAKTEESREAYQKYLQKGQTPKTEYTDKSGKTVKINPSDRRVESVRKLDNEKFQTRESRSVTVYHNYYNHTPVFPPTVVYHDSYNPWFWFWLMDRSIDDRAYWLYNHRDTVDPARYSYLVNKDAQLEARIRQLEAQKTQVDPTYTPKGIDPDLQYNDEFVTAAVNPISVPPISHSTETGSGGGWWFLGILLVLMVIGFIIYGVFYYEY